MYWLVPWMANWSSRLCINKIFTRSWTFISKYLHLMCISFVNSFLVFIFFNSFVRKLLSDLLLSIQWDVKDPDRKFCSLYQLEIQDVRKWIKKRKKKKLDLITLRLYRRVWRYQRGNHNLYIEEEQTTQWPKEKEQKDKQWSTKHTHKAKDWVTRTTLKTGGELRCSGRVSSSYPTSDTRRVNLVTKPVISHERGKDREVLLMFHGYINNTCYH
jgi:hypothetical protein